MSATETQGPAGDRSRMYKNRFKDGEELRRRRNDASIELRKMSKNEQLMKRRNVAVADSDSDTSTTSPLKEKQNQNVSGENDYDNICEGIRSTNPSIKYQNVTLCRRILSREKCPPIEDFTKRKIVPDLVKCLEPNNSKEAVNLVFEAAWALTNVASGESIHTRAVVDAGAVPHFIRLLNCGHDNIAEQSVWALGNIAGDGAELRDLLIKLGTIEPLLKLLHTSTANESLLSNATWFLSNLCRNKNPPPPPSAVKKMLPILADLLMAPFKQVVQDACWALSYLSDAANDRLEELLALPSILPRLVELLAHGEAGVVTPALRSLGNIVTGTDEQTQAVIDAGLLPRCHALLSHVKPNIVKETCWTLSNITAGSQPQIQALIDANLVPRLLDVMTNGDFKSQKEATWACTNLVSGGSETQVGFLVNCGAIPAFCGMMTVNEAKIIIIVLESLRRVLRLAKQYGQDEALCVAIEQCEGLDKLEKLQEHENTRVYEMAYSLVEEFFSADDDDDVKDDVPSSTTTGDAPTSFGFNIEDRSDGATGGGGFSF